MRAQERVATRFFDRHRSSTTVPRGRVAAANTEVCNSVMALALKDGSGVNKATASVLEQPAALMDTEGDQEREAVREGVTVSLGVTVEEKEEDCVEE